MFRFVVLASLVIYQIAAARLLGAPDMMMGADRDEFGCIGSAGYSWCNYTETCQSANEICMYPTSSS